MNLSEVVLSHGKENECTSYPFWAIVSPLRSGRYEMLDGVWFNRKDAEDFLKAYAYNYSKDAQVFCFSGNRSWHMKEIYAIAKEDSTALGETL